MVTAVWSVKGGVGVSSVAAMLAMGHAQQARETLLVDLCGDIPVLLGLEAEPSASPQLGIAEWCALDDPTADALARLEQVAAPDLRFIPRGQGAATGNAAALWSTLAALPRQTIVDCGVVTDATTHAGQLVQAASTSLLVVRECFLTLRAVQRCTMVPSGVVVIKEPQRTLGRADVEAVAGAAVIAELAFDHRVAGSLDAGLVRARLPRPLIRSLGRVLDRAS